LTAAGVGAPLTGNVSRWEGTDFALSVNVPHSYVGGTLTAMGTQWTVAEANGIQVTVSPGTEPPSFLLVDDDNAQRMPPFSSLLTEASDSPSLNILAQAYIHPAYNLPGTGRIAPFRRNIALVPLDVATQQLADGRDLSTVHTPSHWAAYLQGAFQGPENPFGQGGYADHDGDTEPVAFGFTPVRSLLSKGALIFTEGIRDNGLCGFSEVMSSTVAHELGHLFGLRHESGAIMTQGQACSAKPYFSDGGLRDIRETSGQ
jgi:hypothetical protein